MRNAKDNLASMKGTPLLKQPTRPQPITKKRLAFLPPFVQEKMLRIKREGYNSFVYEERTSTIDRGAGPGKPMNLWIASHDRCVRWLYMGGAAAWFEPDSHYVFFDPIPATLLPPEPELNVWWLIYHNDGFAPRVCKITLVPSAKAPKWADL